MRSENAFKLTIERGEDPIRELTVNSTRLLVGSAAHCEVRIDDGDAAPEQLVLEIVDEVIVARSRSRQHGILIDGLPFAEGTIQPSTTIQLGKTRLKIDYLCSTSLTPSDHARRNKPNGWVYGLAGLGFPLAFYLIFNGPNTASTVTKPVDPPRLFRETTEICSTSVATEAKIAAEGELLLAVAMRERAPFHPEDGITAVTHYEIAAACFRTAQELELAAQVSADASALRKNVQESFHVHRARLDYALSTQRYDRARTEIRALLAFLGTPQSEYKTRLKWMDHQIQLKHTSNENKVQ
jgi:hypothetical protein